MANIEKTKVERILPRLPKQMDRQSVILTICVLILLVQIFMCVSLFKFMGAKLDLHHQVDMHESTIDK